MSTSNSIMLMVTSDVPQEEIQRIKGLIAKHVDGDITVIGAGAERPKKLAESFDFELHIQPEQVLPKILREEMTDDVLISRIAAKNNQRKNFVHRPIPSREPHVGRGCKPHSMHRPQNR